MINITTAAAVLFTFSTVAIVASLLVSAGSLKNNDHNHEHPSSTSSTVETNAKVKPYHRMEQQETCQNVPGWYDSGGPFYDCDYYAIGIRCSLWGWGWRNFGLTANEACCVCGGGDITRRPHYFVRLHICYTVYGLQPSCNSNDESGFHMCLDLDSPTNSYRPWMEAFAKAQERWERIIVGDLPSTPSNNLDTQVQGVQLTCTEYPSNIDDVYICGRETTMDGPGRVLGAAIPIYIRGIDNPNQEYFVTVSGLILFDTADIGSLMDRGELENVVFHEMGHVLGIGSLWIENGLYSQGSDHYASGTRAQEEWNALGCSGPLPVETDGGEGTAGGHWDERCLRHEVMSGYLSGSSQPLSRITIGSFQDMGYTVVFDEADPFSISNLGSCGSSCPEASRRRGLGSNSNPQRKLDGDGHDTVMHFAKTQLTALHKELGHSSDDNNGIRVVQEIDVLYQDGSGLLHGVHVTWDQVKELETREPIHP